MVDTPESDPTPNPAPDAEKSDPPPRMPSAVLPKTRTRRFARNFCLGLALTLLVAAVGVGIGVYYMYHQLFEDQPMAMKRVTISKMEVQKIIEKFDSYGQAIYRGYDREVQFSQREFNVFASNWIRKLGHDEKKFGFSISMTGKEVTMYFSMFLQSHKKWVNVKATGELYIADGRMALKLSYAKLGKVEMPESSLPGIAKQIIDHVHNTPAYQEGLGLVRTARLQDAKLHMRLDKKKFREFVNRMKDEGEL